MLKKNKKLIAALLGLLAIAGSVAVAAEVMQNEKPSGKWRYKMTVTVETPEGIKTGSSVREMSNSTPAIDWPDVGNPARVEGEAVVVDLGKRGVLFAVVSTNPHFEFYNAFPLPGRAPGNGGSSPEGIKYYSSLPAGTKGTLNPGAPPGYPMLVTFKDLNDPLSVTEVQEWTHVPRQERGKNFVLTKDRMEELFGEGVKLRDITLEITDEPVTWGMEKWLPWINSLNDDLLDGDKIHRISPQQSTANKLGRGNFTTRRIDDEK